jgi:hypothetical protein
MNFVNLYSWIKEYVAANGKQHVKKYAPNLKGSPGSFFFSVAHP